MPMLFLFRRLGLRSFSSAATPAQSPRAPIRGVIFDAGGVLFSSPMAGLAAALEGRSANVKDAVSSMFGAAAYT